MLELLGGGSTTSDSLRESRAYMGSKLIINGKSFYTEIGPFFGNQAAFLIDQSNCLTNHTSR